MDYKKILKSRKLRIKIMQFLSFIPDELMVKLQYRIKTGRKLNLTNPKRFTEKLQWYKLKYRDPLMAKCVDKYDVREYVESCGLANILVDMYGIYENPLQIDFRKLPDSFVLKDTLGGGGNAVVIVPDKTLLDEKAVRAQMTEWVEEPNDKKHPGREWTYDGKKHRIIIEKYIESKAEEGGLIDYKFFCFNGKVKYLYVIADRDVGKKAGLGIYDATFTKINAHRVDEEPLLRKIEKPGNYDEMVTIAEKLASPFLQARIDLYNVNQQILFSEITFFDGSGYMTFEPDEFDYTLGEVFNLSK